MNHYRHYSLPTPYWPNWSIIWASSHHLAVSVDSDLWSGFRLNVSKKLLPYINGLILATELRNNFFVKIDYQNTVFVTFPKLNNAIQVQFEIKANIWTAQLAFGVSRPSGQSDLNPRYHSTMVSSSNLVEVFRNSRSCLLSRSLDSFWPIFWQVWYGSGFYDDALILKIDKELENLIVTVFSFGPPCILKCRRRRL